MKIALLFNAALLPLAIGMASGQQAPTNQQLKEARSICCDSQINQEGPLPHESPEW